MTSAIYIGLLYGVLLGGAMALLVLMTLWWNPEILLREYPPDIREAYGPMSRRGRRQHVAASVVFLAAIVSIIVGSYYHLAAANGGSYTFLTAWMHATVMFTVFNLVDLIMIDWLVGIRLRPAMIVLPGTEGMAGYDDLRFHVRGFFIGLAITVAVSPIIGGIAMLVQARF